VGKLNTTRMLGRM